MKKFVKSVLAGLTVVAMTQAFASVGVHYGTPPHAANTTYVAVTNPTPANYYSYGTFQPGGVPAPVAKIYPVGTRGPSGEQMDQIYYNIEPPYNQVCVTVVREDGHIAINNDCEWNASLIIPWVPAAK